MSSLALRLTRLLPKASAHGFRRVLLGLLHVERAIYMVNSFQFTRSQKSTSLILAHRPLGSGGRALRLRLVRLEHGHGVTLLGDDVRNGRRDVLWLPQPSRAAVACPSLRLCQEITLTTAP